MDSSLRTRFLRWCRLQGASGPDAASVWTALAGRYGESHRHYHNLDHIASSLAELDATGETDPSIEGAIWFHDVIYDPARADNETASIAWFRRTATWLPPDSVGGIARLIAATDFREPRSGRADEELMVDIDIAILSADPARYDAYRRAVRREYGHVPDDAFRAGRAKVMASFLTRPIYLTPHFAARERKARENIARELALLATDAAPDA